MTVFTQGVCSDGAAILKDGVAMTVEEVLAELKEAKTDATEGFYIKVSNKEKLQVAVGILNGVLTGEDYGVMPGDMALLLNELDQVLENCRNSCRINAEAKG